MKTRSAINERDEDKIKSCVTLIEEYVSQATLTSFKRCSNKEWDGNADNKSLFEFWNYVNSKTGSKQLNNNQEETTKPTMAEDHSNQNQIADNQEERDPSNQDVIADNQEESVAVNRKIIIISDITIRKEENKVCEENFSNTTRDIAKNLNERSPEKLESDVLADVPTPFKSCLFWPQQTKCDNKPRKKEKIPSVATSEQWKTYHFKKQKLKQGQEAAKEERKRKREEKKGLKTNKQSYQKPIKQINEDSSDSSISVNLESEGEGDEWMEEELNKDEKKEKPETYDSSTDDSESIDFITNHEETDNEGKTVQATTSFANLLPLPKVGNLPQKKKSRKTHSKIFTSTPNREELESKENAKERKAALAKNKQVKRSLVDTGERQTQENFTSKKKKVEVATEPCVLCNEFGKDGEWWLVCINCGMAAHAECAGSSIRNDYICDLCIN
ncbi:hypothetical protein MML48_9g00005871 [Holotrichia oblita]|uniref:Uncharacterized protein n=1 Tax=Holotrichia oblita TaxID=644536 RepID=A0ACB9SLV0_HOLOL|nr:hypothetical protein MML48_9g00005871 [Holotrichia oblita]